MYVRFCVCVRARVRKRQREREKEKEKERERGQRESQNGRHEGMHSRARVVVHKDDRLGPSQLKYAKVCPVSKKT